MDKKMTDITVIDALNRFQLGYFHYDGNIYKDSLDIIHRLQNEKAEYEQKLDEGELVSKDWHDEQVLHLQEENVRLKDHIIAECKEHREFVMLAAKKVSELENQRDKLQEQVDELTKKRKRILANKVYSDTTLNGWKKKDLIEQIRILEHNWAGAEESLNIQAKNCEMLLKQKEKDTAKEILDMLYTAMPKTNIVVKIKKRYGVEVE